MSSSRAQQTRVSSKRLASIIQTVRALLDCYLEAHEHGRIDRRSDLDLRQLGRALNGGIIDVEPLLSRGRMRPSTARQLETMLACHRLDFAAPDRRSVDRELAKSQPAKLVVIDVNRLSISSRPKSFSG